MIEEEDKNDDMKAFKAIRITKYLTKYETRKTPENRNRCVSSFINKHKLGYRTFNFVI